MNEKIIEITKKKTKEKLESIDQKIINLSLISDKLEFKINEITELLKIISNQEYPSLDQHLSIKEYCLFYNNDREIKLSEEKIKKIKEIEGLNIGIKLKENIKKIIKDLSKNILNLIAIKEEIDLEIDILIKNNYPNLYLIATPKITSKMIEISGSIERLSRFPASTIQLLGSEKSFFKALRFNKKTPKYGILYNHPLILNLSYKNKGKIARTIAAKIAIAAKADIEKKDISKEIYNKIKKKISELKWEE